MKIFSSILTLFIISFIFYSCATSPFINLDNIKEDLKLKDFPEQNDYPEDDGLVLYESHDESVILNDEYKFETVEGTHNVIKLFKNIDEYATIEFAVPSGDKLLALDARIVKPNGEIIQLKPEDFHTVLGNEDDYTFYSDAKMVKFTFPSVEKNSIIEYTYKIDEQYPFIMDVWDIQGELPKLFNAYNLTVPYLLLMKEVEGGAGWSWKYTDYNCKVPSPKIQNDVVRKSVKNKYISLNWEQTNIPAFKPDPMMPAYKNYLKYLKFAPMKWKTWNDVSEWYYYDIFKPKIVITDYVAAMAKELTLNCSSEVDRIKCIYNFVQSLRYVDIDLGKVSITPEYPEKTLKRKYGDCKDKATLLIAMLKSLGIQANPVLALTRDKGFIDNNFPCWNFNHMIVRVSTKEKKIVWIDPATRYCKLDFLPYQCADINALVLNDDGTSEIEYIPKNSQTDNIENFYMKLDLSNADSIKLDVGVKYKGEFNLKNKNHFSEKTKSEMLKYCKSMISDYYLNAEVLDYSISNLDSTDADLKLNFSAKVQNIAIGQDGLTFLNMDPMKLPGNWEWLGREKRTYDIEFNYPYTVYKTIEMILPENKYIIKDLPANYVSSEQGLSYIRNFNVFGNDRIIVSEKFSITQTDIKVEYYKAVRDFFDKIKSKLNEKIILTTK